MGKHTARDNKGNEATATAKGDRTYIGAHRPKDDVQPDSRGFSVGRGVTGDLQDRGNNR